MPSTQVVSGVPTLTDSDSDVMGIDSAGLFIVGSGRIKPQVKVVTFNLCANGSLGTQTFFIADRAYTVAGISYVHKTACTGTLTALTGGITVTKDTGVLAPGAGVALQAGVFDPAATVNTVQTGVLSATPASLQLATGDRLAVLFGTGTITSLAGVVISVYLTPCNKSETAVYYANVNADIKTQTFFIANRDMTITGVQAVYLTPFVAAATLTVTKDTGTTAAGGGTSILLTPMAADGTANTVLTPALAASAATLKMAAGDRLAVKFSATTTGVGVCVVVSFAPLFQRTEISWQLGINGQQQVAQCFFIADRDYHVVDLSDVFDVTAGGASKIGVTIDKGTTVPGGGNVVQTDNGNAGFDQAATARTVQVGTLASVRLRQMSAGDRLGLVVAGAAQSTVLNCITGSLEPR